LSKASQIRQKAQEYLSKGQTEKAIGEYKRLLTVESKNPNLYNELGDIFLRAADRAAAVQNFERAAVIYEKVALYNNAVAVCKKILRVEPEKLATIFKLGELRAKQKLEGEAVAYFTQYAELALMNSQSLPKCQKDIERMMELMSASDTVMAKAAEMFEQMGMKLKAAEIIAKLAAMAVERGDAEKHRKYTEKLGALKRDLTTDEVRNVDALSASQPPLKPPGAEPEAPGPAASAAAPPPKASAQPSGRDESAPASAESAEAEKGEMTAPARPEASEKRLEQGQDRPAPPEERGHEFEPGVREAVEEAEMIAAMARGVDVGSECAREEKTPARESGGAQVQVAEKPRPEPKQPRPASPAPVSASVEDQTDVERELAEEITSDVEKDDLKSHYDLGMAYLEMGLYTEAIKDFQISSRCEELKLSSMEMIGHCFLKQENPRLAVKQLTKALEVAAAAGAESLGIHYNLGLAYEMLGELAAAREHFEEVYIVDMTFRDVAQKMKKLASSS
jgi:tetratricopeptide (TPR) repeat protein